MAILISDDFDRADNDSLGANWTEDSGDWDIASNVASSTAASRATWTGTFNTAGADYDVSGDLRITASVAGVGVIGRFVDLDNFYHARINTFSQYLRLQKRVGGTDTTLGQYNGGQSTGNTYVVKLSMVGSTIKVFQDGTERISVTDSALTATGLPGIWSDSNVCTVNNFLVEGTEASAGGTYVNSFYGPSGYF